MARKSSDKARPNETIVVPESITAYLQADQDFREQLEAIRVRPKDMSWSGILEHQRMRLTLQQLQTDYTELLYALWEHLWRDAVAEFETLELMPYPNLWTEGAIWRRHKPDFCTGLMFGMDNEKPEIQLALYADQAKLLKGFEAEGWAFDSEWGMFTTTQGLVPFSSEEPVNLQLLQQLAFSAAVQLKTLNG